MALSVENPAAHLTPIRKSFNSWNYGGEVCADYPGLEGSVRELLERDESESSCERRILGKANRLYSPAQKVDEGIRRSPGRNEGLFLTSPTRFSQQTTNYWERKPQLTSAKHSSESFYKGSCALNHPQEQKVSETHVSFSEEYPQQSTYQTLTAPHTRDNMDFSGIQRTVPSYSSSPKCSLSKTIHCPTRSPRYSENRLSFTLPEACSPPQERMRSRSMSAARYPSSGTFTSRFRQSRADLVDDCLAGSRRPVQRSFSSALETNSSWKDNPFQADYWACALPNIPPPSPNRQSPHWDPDKEYQDLLDYTYPLNSKQIRSKEISEEFISPEPFLHDSGIGLDSISVSPDDMLQSGSPFYDHTQHAKGSHSNFAGKYLTSSQQLYTKLSTSTDCLQTDSVYQPISAGKAAFETYSTSSENISSDFKIPFYTCTFSSSETSSSVDGSEWGGKDEHTCTSKQQRDVGFVPTTKVLQFKREWDSDDEYLSLPPRVKELENLAQQLKELSVTAQECGYENKKRDHQHCTRSSDKLSLKYGDGLKGKFDSDTREDTEDMVDYGFRYDGPHRTSVKSCSQGQGDAASGLRRLSSLRYMLDSEKDEQQIGGNESLVHCIKMFCSKLEDLIQWLYKVAEVTEKWVPPKPDVESIQSALQLYLKFKKDVIGQQTVADSVVKMGEILVETMAANSPDGDIRR
ncbi:centrosomal protein of 68 kDa isoform X2 [Lissotriton helveticus]